MEQQLQTSTPPSRWPLARVLILVLAGMYAGLLADIRVEHVEVVHEKTVAWIPIIYSAVAIMFCMATFLVWTKFMRRLMLVVFLASAVTGFMGVYFHTHGRFIRIYNTTRRAWTDPEMNHPDGPPLTAPMGFVGFGLLGALCSLEIFANPKRHEQAVELKRREQPQGVTL